MGSNLVKAMAATYKSLGSSSKQVAAKLVEDRKLQPIAEYAAAALTAKEILVVNAHADALTSNYHEGKGTAVRMITQMHNLINTKQCR